MWKTFLIIKHTLKLQFIPRETKEVTDSWINLENEYEEEDEDENVGKEKEDINSDFESSTDDIFELF